MSEGLAAVQGRIAALQALVGPGRQNLASPTVTFGAGSSSFADTLAGIYGATGAAASGGSSTSGSGTLGERAVALAAQYNGVPYRWGGTDPARGLDCSGLTQQVYGQLGITLPRTSGEQAKAGTPVASLDAAQPGDLVFFGAPVHHVGIYVGNGQMIDAPHTGSSVGVHKVWATPSAIRRVVPGSQLQSTGSPVAGSGQATSLTGPFADLFTAAGQKYGVDPALLSAVAKAESGYDTRAVSPAGARGLMQLMPATARSLGVNPLDPTQAVDGAARMLSGLLTSFGGRTDLALAGYNAGAGAVRRYGGVPPYTETRTYVDRVTRYWEALR